MQTPPDLHSAHAVARAQHASSLRGPGVSRGQAVACAIWLLMAMVNGAISLNGTGSFAVGTVLGGFLAAVIIPLIVALLVQAVGRIGRRRDRLDHGVFTPAAFGIAAGVAFMIVLVHLASRAAPPA
jgi:hypothetical protein